jgi:hypothetical protein
MSRLSSRDFYFLTHEAHTGIRPKYPPALLSRQYTMAHAANRNANPLGKRC